MNFTLESPQRTAVVSGVGTTRGIGRATAQRLAKEGWAVACADLDGDAARTAAADLAQEFGVPTFGGGCDVSSQQSVQAFVEVLRGADLPPVGAVVPLAGIPAPQPIHEVTLQLWEKVFAVNSTGTYLFVQPFLPDMIDAGKGRLVCMCSV